MANVCTSNMCLNYRGAFSCFILILAQNLGDLLVQRRGVGSTIWPLAGNSIPYFAMLVVITGRLLQRSVAAPPAASQWPLPMGACPFWRPRRWRTLQRCSPLADRRCEPH